MGRRPEVIVVTGASAGLGRAVVREFAREGAHIGLIARGEERLETTRAEVEQLGGKGLVLPLDVADAGALEDAADRVERELGSIDVWINNAMLSVYSPIREMRAEEYERVTQVTYLGYVYGTLAALKRMLPRDRGIIIQISSSLAYVSIPIQSAYCAGKHAVRGFTSSLRAELIHDRSKIRVTMVQMPAINTPQFDWSMNRMAHRPEPVPPIFQPEMCASAVRYAVRHDVGRELVVTWSARKLILGGRFVPGYVERRVAREAYEDQESSEPETPDRPHNLWGPVAGDWAARGRFDLKASERSLALWLRMHRMWTALGGILLVLTIIGVAVWVGAGR
ncbi:MAG TPA: SDR family oxidoreductase [Gemmatimonadaceae bacterium]|nr:SDR family oxidoreductase [Gemmatimonadaceae bacterium]